MDSVSREGGSGLLVRRVSLSRGGRLVLCETSLAVPRGRVTALIGPSGAGKSTLLRCLTRLLEPDAGEVFLNGVRIEEVPPRELRRRVGLVAQQPVMLPGSVSQNVRYGLDHVGDDVVLAAIGDAGLDGTFAARSASALSGGERARVAMARAIARGPELLLLDEPTAAIDEPVARRLGSTLRRLAASGLGVLIATHDLRFAEAVADRIEQLAAPPRNDAR